MSDIDAKINAVLDKFDDDIEQATQRLEPILQSNNLDELSEAEPEAKTAVPYALGAYALSSMLFAYLRSEGRDTAIVMPELARVKERLERLNAPSRQGSEAPSDAEKPRASPQPQQPPKRTGKGKHLRFDDANNAPKRSKRSKSRS